MTGPEGDACLKARDVLNLGDPLSLLIASEPHLALTNTAFRALSTSQKCISCQTSSKLELPRSSKRELQKGQQQKKNTAPGTQSETKVTKSAPATKTVIFTELYILLLCFSDLHRLSWSFLFLTFSDLSFSFFLFPLRFLPFLIFPFLVFPFLTFTILIFPFLSTNSIDS